MQLAFFLSPSVKVGEEPLDGVPSDPVRYTTSMLPADHPETRRRFQAELDLVSIVVAQTMRLFGRFVEVDDLQSFGHEGLLQAARTYDPSREVPFRRWANVRVRGAVYDGVRRSGRLPRRLYLRVQALASAALVTEAADEQQSGDAAPRTALEADEAVRDRLGASATAMAAAILAARSIDDETLHVPDTRANPEETAALKQLAGHLRAAVDGRDDPEKTLLLRMYWQGESLEEAGAAVGLSRSWACRIHARAIGSIGKQLRSLVE